VRGKGSLSKPRSKRTAAGKEDRIGEKETDRRGRSPLEGKSTSRLGKESGRKRPRGGRVERKNSGEKDMPLEKRDSPTFLGKRESKLSNLDASRRPSLSRENVKPARRKKESIGGGALP